MNDNLFEQYYILMYYKIHLKTTKLDAFNK